MHEISVLSKAIDLVNQVAKDNNIEHVKKITLEVGELTGYLPIFFEKYFPIIIEGNPLYDEAKLEIKVIKGQALCNECEAFYNVMKNEGKCPVCGSREKTIISGQDFIVKNVEY